MACRQATSFGDALDTALGARPPSPRPSGAGILTAGLFALPFSPRWRGVSAFRAAAGPIVSIPGPTAPAPTRSQPRTSTEHEAFRLFQDAGAALAPAFTANELKRAFRRLARDLHPDRHPATSEVERNRLGAAFAAVRDNYLRLLALFD